MRNKPDYLRRTRRKSLTSAQKRARQRQNAPEQDLRDTKTLDLFTENDHATTEKKAG